MKKFARMAFAVVALMTVAGALSTASAQGHHHRHHRHHHHPHHS